MCDAFVCAQCACWGLRRRLCWGFEIGAFSFAGPNLRLPRLLGGLSPAPHTHRGSIGHLLPRVRSGLMPLPAPLAVDVGCGSGQGTVLLAPYFNQVFGTDVSPAQLENAQANQQCANVSYRQSPAEDLPFESGTVDLVTSMTAAHWFDRPRFLEEAYRVLKPGGCLALLSYTLNMDLEYGEVSDKLNDVCKEFYAALLPFRNPHIGSNSVQLYKDMFDSCPYPDKEWCECLEVRRPVPLNGYIGVVQTFTSFRKLKEHDSQQAQELTNRTRNKLLNVMQVSSPETEVTMVTKYFYWIAWKP